MLITAVVQVLVGLLTPVLLARIIHRRWDVPCALLLPGAIAGLAALLLGALLEGGVLAALTFLPDVLNLPVYAGVLGFLTGLLSAGLITVALIWLAPGARSAPQIAMLGAGYGGAEMVMRAVLAGMVLVANFQLVDKPVEDWSLPPDEVTTRQAEVEAYFDTPAIEPLLESVVALGKIALGLSLALLVGSMFVTGEIGWFFGAVIWGAVGVIGPLMFARGGPMSSAVWWAIVGAASVVIAIRRSRRV